MKDVFRRLGSDFLSTIVFLVIYLATDNVILATGIAVLGAIGQVIWSRIKGHALGYMTWASLGLVIVLGGATLLTHDPRFVLAKPAIGHVAIGSHWFKYLCQQRGLDSAQTFHELAGQYFPGQICGPFHYAARQQAGFSAAELKALEQMGSGKARG